MINGVATAAVGVSLKQTKLAQETLVIGNRYQAARQQRQTFQIDFDSSATRS